MKLSVCCGAPGLGQVAIVGVCCRCREFTGFEEVCPECLEPRPGDERVEAGMKCGPCAYGHEEVNECYG